MGEERVMEGGGGDGRGGERDEVGGGTMVGGGNGEGLYLRCCLLWCGTKCCSVGCSAHLDHGQEGGR